MDETRAAGSVGARARCVHSDITGLVLAGGQSQRLGGRDKGLIELAGRPMIAYVLAALAPQVGAMLISANRNLERYRDFGFPVLPDQCSAVAGPLAGIATALTVVRTKYVLVVPCDAPFVSPNLPKNLLEALTRASADVAVAHDGTRPQPAFALLRKDLQDDLGQYLKTGGRQLSGWHARLNVTFADMHGEADSFVNVNAPDDCVAAEMRLHLANRQQ